MSAVNLIYTDEAFIPVELNNMDDSEVSKKNLAKSSSKDNLTSKKGNSHIKNGEKRINYLYQPSEESVASSIEKSLSKKNNNKNNNNNNNGNSNQKVINCLDNSNIFDILEGITTSLESLTNKNPPNKASLIQQISSNKLNKELEKKKESSKKSKKLSKKDEKSGRHSKNNSTTSIHSKNPEKEMVTSSSHHSLASLTKETSKTNPNNNEDKKKSTNEDGSRSLINILKNNSTTTSLSNVIRGNSFSNYSISSMAKMDENNTIENNKKKDTKTEVDETKKESEDQVNSAEVNDNVENQQRLISLNGSINSLLDSVNNSNSLRSSEEYLNSQGSLSVLDQKSSIDFSTFMNNKENELNKKNKGRKHDKDVLNSKEDENINPFFLLNPELLESSSSEESLPLIESLKIDSNSFEKEVEKAMEKENVKREIEKQKVEEKESISREKEKEKDNNKKPIEEADISEITNTEVDLSSFKKLDIPKIGNDKNSFLELAFYNSFNNSQKANDKKENNDNEESNITNSSKERKRKDIEYIDIPIDKEIIKTGVNLCYLHKKEKPVIPERALSFNDANKEKEKEINRDEFKFYKPYNSKSSGSPLSNKNENTEDLSENARPKLQLNSREIPPYPENYGKNNRKLRQRGHDNKSKYNKQVKVVPPNDSEIELSAHNKRMKTDKETEQDQYEVSSTTTSSDNSLYQDEDESERYLRKKNKQSIFDSLKILSDSESLMNLKVNNNKPKEKEAPSIEENLSTKNRNFIFNSNEPSSFDLNIQSKTPETKKAKREFEGSSNSLDLINNNNIKYRFGVFSNVNNNPQITNNNNKESKNEDENVKESVASLFQSKENSLDSLIKQNETITVDDPEIFKYGLDMRDAKNDIKDIINSNYKLEKGTFGTIYFGYLNNVKQPIAVKEIKFIEQVEKKSIYREVSKIKKWEHPNLVKYHGCLVKRNIVWLMMDYAQEFSLLKLMNLVGETFTEIETKAVMATLVNAFSFLHSKNIVHRNIKCSNIFVSGDGVLKIGIYRI